MKLTKKDLNSLVSFNKLRKRIGEKPMNPDEYLRYLYGKTEKISTGKPKPLKSKDIPIWATDVRSIASVTSDHIALKKNDDFKKEISKHYPIAPPANKMGYQVLLNSEIKTAGRKV